MYVYYELVVLCVLVLASMHTVLLAIMKCTSRMPYNSSYYQTRPVVLLLSTMHSMHTK